MTDLGTGGLQVGYVGSLVVGANLEGAASTGGGLFEDQGDVLALEVLNLAAFLLSSLEFSGQV